MLQEGDKLPRLDVRDDSGSAVGTYDLIGSRHLVLWFYPQDDTPG